ncbi:hypothetical protein KP509_04G107700 [Ceratopteris richardii]|uniref:Uncharacterized protein n=1 Tax=Ceratopteris richardii TaxID=49495 RepID=A0A8T2V024_CERRI|nr:hypothetical protein KP509_04G107700 [Ceratopteris richardii]
MSAIKEVVKRVPLIKFPIRRPPASSGNSGQVQTNQGVGMSAAGYFYVPDVPVSPKNQGFGGSASIQPRRTPVTDGEIEAIMLGGAC